MDKHVDLIGAPFVYGARGPAAFDCWGLVAEMYRRWHGIEIPDFASASDQPNQHALGAMQLLNPKWIEVKRQPGAVVAIRIGRFVSHCGFLIDADTMIHAWENSGGVTVTRTYDWERRIAGFYLYD